MRDIGDADMDKRTRSFIAKGAAVLGLAAAGAAARFASVRSGLDQAGMLKKYCWRVLRQHLSVRND